MSFGLNELTYFISLLYLLRDVYFKSCLELHVYIAILSFLNIHVCCIVYPDLLFSACFIFHKFMIDQQCWYVIKAFLWHSPQSNSTNSAHEFNPQRVGTELSQFN